MRRPQLTFPRLSVCVRVGVISLPALLLSQSGGRFEEAKRQGIGYLESGQYDRAAARFEEVWEQDQSDASVAENLAIAYMNGEDRNLQGMEEKVRRLTQRSVQMGGKASFLVQHSHERLTFFRGDKIIRFCSGRLSVTPGRLVFVAQARKGEEEHSFDFSPEEIQIVPPSKGDNQGGFQIKAKSRTYSMAPRTRTKFDGDLLVSVVQQYIAAKEPTKGK